METAERLKVTFTCPPYRPMRLLTTRPAGEIAEGYTTHEVTAYEPTDGAYMTIEAAPCP
jgi:hypothetical protein